MAGIHPTQVIIGIAGRAGEGLHHQPQPGAPKPDAPITEQELDKLIEGVQREALLEAERSITWETGLPSVDVRLVHAAVTGLAPSMATRSPTRSASRAATCASACSTRSRRSSTWARSRPSPSSSTGSCWRSSRSRTRWRAASTRTSSGPAGALFVDVGGGTTDVALVRQGGVEGTRMFALGGRAFTKSLADRLEVSFAARRGGQDRVRDGPAGRRPGDHRGHHRRGRRGLVGGRGAGARGVRQARPAAGAHRAVRRRLAAAPAGRRAARQGRSPATCRSCGRRACPSSSRPRCRPSPTAPASSSTSRT